MADRNYYKRQAKVCAGLALSSRDREVAERFRLLAMEYTMKAGKAAGEDESGPMPHEINPEMDSGDGEQGRE